MANAIKNSDSFMTLSGVLVFVTLLAATPSLAGGQLSITFEDVNPDQSDTDPNDPDGATGGRVNGLAAHPTSN